MKCFLLSESGSDASVWLPMTTWSHVIRHQYHVMKSYLAYQIMKQHHAPILWVWLMFGLAAVATQLHCVVAIVIILSGQPNAADCCNDSPTHHHMTNHSPHLLIPLLSSNNAQQLHNLTRI